MRILNAPVLSAVVLAAASAGGATHVVRGAPTTMHEAMPTHTVRYPTAKTPKRARKSTRWIAASAPRSE